MLSSALKVVFVTSFFFLNAVSFEPKGIKTLRIIENILKEKKLYHASKTRNELYKYFFYLITYTVRKFT